MTHNENRSNWLKEGAIGLGVGVLYGTTSVAVGHPWDTVKTKMQAQRGYAESGGMLRTIGGVYAREGLRGFYRGCIPPLCGSGVYRSTQFAVFEAVYTYLDTPALKAEIPGTFGLQWRVLVAGMAGSSARALIESPLELIKVRRQTGQSWTVGAVYTGFSVTWLRTMGLMTSYFIMIDSCRRNLPSAFERPILGPFIISGVAATLGWWLVWPLENMKSQVQGGYGTRCSLWTRLGVTVRERGGLKGLYRGIWPGTIRSFVSNGCSMVVMQYAQRKVTEFGLRNN